MPDCSTEMTSTRRSAVLHLAEEMIALIDTAHGVEVGWGLAIGRTTQEVGDDHAEPLRVAVAQRTDISKTIPPCSISTNFSFNDSYSLFWNAPKWSTSS